MKNLSEFWSELRRRRVVRVAIAYAAVAWLLIEVSSVIVPELRLPGGLTRVIILIAMAGFPVILIAAWVWDITPGGLRVTQHPDQDADGSATDAASVPRAVFLSFIIGVLLTAGALYFYQVQRQQSRNIEIAHLRIPEIRELVESHQYVRAFALAEEVESILENDQPLEPLWPEISDWLTVETDPVGAAVTARLISRQDSSKLGEEVKLGITPLKSRRIARSDFLIQIRKEGYATENRIVSSKKNRIEFKGPEVHLELSLIPEEESPSEMVFVPGGRYEIISPDMPRGLSAILDDFFIDRYEVSNADFAQFTREGRYQQQSYWPNPADLANPVEDLEPVITGLVDASGKNAPRGWRNQAPPAGRDNHPVTGVSWLEAFAYCAWKGKRLPSIFQWEKAARNGNRAHAEGVIMPWGYVSPGDPDSGRANFNSDDTVPVDAMPAGISPFGAYGMAGNVKEWTGNPSGIGRIVTGGSWEDPDYLFSAFAPRPESFASHSLGFRCVQVRADDARRTRDQGSFALNMDNSTPTYEPVGTEQFDELLKFYRYDPMPGRPQTLEVTESEDWTREKISYLGPQNERVLAYLWLPKSSAPPFQTILFVPGVTVFFARTVPESSEQTMGVHVRSGRALFAPVLKGMVEREWGPDFEMPAMDSIRFRDLMVRHATELRLGLDYLETRDDINIDQLAYAGLSLGAGSRLTFAAVDDRYGAVVFIGGGIDERMKPNLPEADNINFAPYITAPKLMVNGRRDDEHPWLTRGLPLWNLLSEPKKKVVFDGAGHVPAEHLRAPVIDQFLDEVFGPPR